MPFREGCSELLERFRAWRLCLPLCLAVSGAALLVHEQNGWYFARAAFLHHALGWTLIAGSVVCLGRAVRPRSPAFNAGFAVMIIAVAALLFCDRNVAPIFGHLSPLAGAR